MKRIVTGLCSAILLSTSSYAEGNVKRVLDVEPIIQVGSQKKVKNFYAGLGISLEQVKSHNYGSDTVIGVTIKAGHDFSEYFAVEFRGSKDLGNGDQLSLDYSYGFYLKPQYVVSEKVNIYGLLGYAKTKISFENEAAFNGINNDYTTQNGFSFGVGLAYKLDEDWSLFVDATRLIDKSTTKIEGEYAIKVDGGTFGFVYHF